MKPIRLLPYVCLLICNLSKAQEFDKSTIISVFAGAMNYQGDVKPNSFTIDHSKFAWGLSLRKPINKFLAIRVGGIIGTITAADRWNNDELRPRNLSFTTEMKEAYLGFEIAPISMASGLLTPYLYFGIGAFHFNPWTTDNNNEKYYLQPLSTEGQGLAQYPDKQPYKLTQLCIPYGVGGRIRISDDIKIGLEFNQRKSFTDYIDDVSNSYVDRDVLLQAKGIKAVELAYRADEIPGGLPLFPGPGEKRGTPTQMDWFYSFGLTYEMKLSRIRLIKRTSYDQKCPKSVYY